MAPFCGSYHWKTLKDFVTQIFVCVDLAAAVVLETAALPNRCRVGDIVVLSGSDNQWYICNAVTGAAGDFTAIVPWEASLIAVNPIAQFPGDVHIQDVLDNTLSGDTGGTGNPFDIITTTQGIGAGVVAPAAGTVRALNDVIAGVNVLTPATGGVGAGVAAPANGNVQAVAAVIAGTDVTTGALGGVGAGVANPANGNVESVAQVIAGTDVTATTGGILCSLGDVLTTAGTGGYISADANRARGTDGLQAGVTAGDFVITRLRRSVLNLVGAPALAAGATADENLVAVVPADAIVVGLQASAALTFPADCVAQARVNAVNVIQVRYGNIHAVGAIAVAADANLQALWIQTVVI